MKIRVISIPPGSRGDPEMYRALFVGLTFDVKQVSVDEEWGRVYEVDGEQALRALATCGHEKAEEACVWYTHHRAWWFASGPRFPVGCCEPVDLS